MQGHTEASSHSRWMMRSILPCLVLFFHACVCRKENQGERWVFRQRDQDCKLSEILQKLNPKITRLAWLVELFLWRNEKDWLGQHRCSWVWRGCCSAGIFIPLRCRWRTWRWRGHQLLSFGKTMSCIPFCPIRHRCDPDFVWGCLKCWSYCLGGRISSCWGWTGGIFTAGPDA